MYKTEKVVAPVENDTLLTFLTELYNPMLDAKCFNDKYNVPTVNKQDLYADYKKIFEWGLKNPSDSPLYAQSSGVTSNRFPSMCLRMVFHDNAIADEDGADYVVRNIDPVTGKWKGPDMMLPTSGGDASVLTCKPERFHPNNNYDQTASRILHAFQSTESYPKGPGIGNGKSLMSKHGLSYADSLHNCGLAALRFMIETDANDSTKLQFAIPDDQMKGLLNMVDKMTFGRKDACYITDNATLLFSDELGANSRRPLCGPSDILPGVTLSAKGVSNWFENRGMPVGVWLSLFGTHTALDNFSDPTNIRNFGLPQKDYFKDYVGCPFHKLRAPVVDPEDGGCDWTPTCQNPSNTALTPWKMVQSDCATSIGIIRNSGDASLKNLQTQMKIYIDSPGKWIPDIVCALGHLGGNNEKCAGPNSVTPGQESKFGSCWRNDFPIPPKVVCDFKCPANSSPVAKCMVDFSGCQCNKGYVQNKYGNGCEVEPSIKYKDCTDKGYTLDFCQKRYGRLRRLKQVDARRLVEADDSCSDADYDMYLVIHGAHFAGLATPKDDNTCPAVVFHAEASDSSSPMTKIVLHAEPEDLDEVEEDAMLHLGVKSLSEIVAAFENAPVGKSGKLYDAVSNNCVAMLRNMADPLDIAVDDRMISFVSRKLLEGSAEHMFEMMKESPALNTIVNGGRRLLQHLSDEDLLSKVIMLYA